MIKERGNAILRILDRFAGIPLVYLIGLAKLGRRTKTVPAVKRAAFLMTAAIGDTILLSAAIKDVRRAYPEAQMTLFSGATNREVAIRFSGADRVIELPVANPLRAAKIIGESGHFDLWMDFGAWARLNALLSACANASFKVGFHTGGQYRHYVYDKTVIHSPCVHELQNYKELIRSAGIAVTDDIPSVGVHGALDPRIITIHMFPGGTRSSYKEWPQDSWKMLIQRFLKQGYRIVLTGSRIDRERALRFASEFASDGISVVAGTQDLQGVAELLKSSRVVITVNTGIMHLAAALGCNIVALHGPTSALRWGPLNTNSIVLSARSACAPCLSLGFEYKCSHPKCLETITVDEVDAAARTLLERQAQ